mmetsp:Transcript_32317/g.84744  ORF Transcript_32317/g.84744 Transcript_32317/m.84744 type:complete len:335 (-) Transcript_32317:238-1242(-)
MIYTTQRGRPTPLQPPTHAASTCLDAPRRIWSLACAPRLSSLGASRQRQVVRRCRRPRSPRIEEDGHDDEGGATAKRGVRLEAKERHRGQARDDDGDGHREVFQVVVGETDDDGHEQSAEGEHADHRPSRRAESYHPAVGLHLVPVSLPYRHQLQRDGEHAELHIAHPDRCLVTLEDALEVDGGEARADGHAERRHDADGHIALVQALAGLSLRRLRHDNAADEHTERTPLVAPQRFGEDDHAKDGRRERLRLVQKLKQLSAEVRGCNELQVVLQRETKGGDGDLESVHLPLIDITIKQYERRQRPTLSETEHRQAEDELQHFSKEHRDRNNVL